MMLSVEAEALQCVPFAREVSGISIRGDAWTWWSAAAGQYDRGHAPRVGAVVVFKKHGSMRHGHVAVVNRVVNSREVLVDHANWAPQRGMGRGRVSTMVKVTDVSPHNDWTEVRVWNTSSQDFGTRTYPTYGFIYPAAGHGRHPGRDAAVGAEASADPTPAATAAEVEALARAISGQAAGGREAAAGVQAAADEAAATSVSLAQVGSGSHDAISCTAGADGVWTGDLAAARRFGSGRY